ncbi:hypothetical protein FRC02_002724 [Tulasnella sp. 418]|nr:hypothetical protein FRC02_002724 [Tulasnella sp. 418]
MSYFSNHSQHSISSDTSNSPATTTTATVQRPRAQQSSSSLRSTSKHFSLSVSNANSSNGINNTGDNQKDKSTSPSNGGGTGASAASGGGTGTAGPVGPKMTGPTPLRCTWVFWFRQQRAPGKTANYEEGIKKVAAFSSVESFWCLHTHLNPPSSLQPTTDYLLFHSLVKRPVWEDPLNENGGKWIIRLRKGLADRLWEDLILGVIGDQFEEEDGICGCVLSVRGNEDILSVWNKDDKDVEAKARIEEGIRKALNLPQATKMEYKSNNGECA